jgi:hypothetical protein
VTPFSLPSFMKKYIICTLLSISTSRISHAQENLHNDFARISTPYVYFNDGTYNGKNLLFDNEWVKAKLLTSDNSVINNDTLLFNFDKIDQRLLVTADFKNVFQIDWREFKAILFYRHDSGYVYKHISFISHKDLFQVLINGDGKYSLFKTIHTKVVKGSYGNASFGRTTDKYLDVPEYCILFPNREFRIIHLLKKAAIERVFDLNPDYDKVEDYLNMNNKTLYEEADLEQLIQYLNKMSL